MVGAEAGVSVPRAGGAVAVKDLDEADPALGEPAGRQHLLAERAGDVLVEAVEPPRSIRPRPRSEGPRERPFACGRPARTT